MPTITTVKGFISVAATTLPKGILVLSSNIKDGVFLLAIDFVIPYDSYGNDIQRASLNKRTLKAGSLVMSTEGGHYYVFNAAKGGLSGVGKHGGALTGALVQKVSIKDIVIDKYTRPRKIPKKKKKVAKKAKKKVSKKRR